MPPATDASNNSSRFCARASASSSTPLVERSCLLAVTTDFRGEQRPPDEIAGRLEAPHQLDDDVGIDATTASSSRSIRRHVGHPVDLLPLDSAVADRRQLQRG
jgi:hypothetical protein